jgi:uroporphyrinogen-III synthase
MTLSGMRVISFESRRAAEMATLIRNQRGDAFVAPSMREAPLADNEDAFRFAERLFSGEFDMMIFLTGVGARALNGLLATRYPAGRFPEALRRLTVVARGPKPVAALRELDVPVTVAVPEPNTWREVLAATRGRLEKRIAVQEYGRPSPELVEALRARGAEVTTVRIYQWQLPEDLGPLREAVRRIVAGQADVAMFTTAFQVPHLFRIAAEAGAEDSLRASLRNMVIASIGPATGEMLDEFGIPADITPSHPKMGFLVKETAEQSASILARKRASPV